MRGPRGSRPGRWPAGLAAALAMLGAMGVVATAAATWVPLSRASASAQATTAEALKPGECGPITVTARVVGAVSVVGGPAGELILGSALIDTMAGQGGTDCLVGGGLADTVNGNEGDDVLLGGPGADLLDGGAGFDHCYGGPDLDTFLNCEVVGQ